MVGRSPRGGGAGGELTAAAVQKRVHRFGGQPNSLTRELEELCLSTVANPEVLAAAALPSMEVLDKILRHETRLERQSYRAMAQLERIQRMRLGKVVPAPLFIEISDQA